MEWKYYGDVDIWNNHTSYSNVNDKLRDNANWNVRTVFFFFIFFVFKMFDIECQDERKIKIKSQNPSEYYSIRWVDFKFNI